MLQGPWAPVVERQTQVLQELGVTDPPTDTPQDTWYLKHDAVVQMCPPSLEYPRSDVAAHVKFAGCISPQRHPQPLAADFMYPHWWEEVTNREKKVVMVTQGTVITNPHDLVIPVIEALARREDSSSLSFSASGAPNSLNPLLFRPTHESLTTSRTMHFFLMHLSL
jgi:hypothetical protein